jgi:hypothetical protein
MLYYEKNCFECHGTLNKDGIKPCKNYYLGHEKKYCVFKDVSNNDLDKYKNGDKHTTLTVMLNDYILIHPELKIK